MSEEILPPRGRSVLSRPIPPQGGAGHVRLMSTKVEKKSVRQLKLEELVSRLSDQIETLTMLPDGTRITVPIERLPVLADTVRQLAETEAILAGIEHEG